MTISLISITKKPKKVKVKYNKMVSYCSEYACPSCKTIFIGTGIKKNIIRFKCDCGQELIVE